MASLAIMGVSLLGLAAGLVVAFTANGRSSRRTQMVEFAQSRFDRFNGATKKDICTVTSTNVDCSKMATGGTFDPTSAANTGGWMMDVLDRATSMTASAGVDVMAGPVVVLGDLGAVDEAATVTTRTAVASDAAGCASTTLTTNMLCREIHIELDATNVFYHIWVRVVRGGKPTDGPVYLEGMVAK